MDLSVFINYITQLCLMIICGTWICVENKKKNKKTKKRPKTKFLSICFFNGRNNNLQKTIWFAAGKTGR